MLIYQTLRSIFRLLPGQFQSPLVFILVFAAFVSGVAGEWVDAGIVLVWPHLPFVPIFGFISLQLPLILAMLEITLLYIFATELTKLAFYLRIENANA